MRKKLLIVWVIFIAGLFAWTNLRRQNIENEKLQQATSSVDSHKDQEESSNDNNIAVPFPVKSIEPAPSQMVEDIKNVSVSPEALIAKWKDQPTVLANSLIEDSKRLSECLLKDLCGEEPSPDSPYFDKNNTPSHSLLEHELTTLAFLQESNSFNEELLPKSDLEQMLDIQNESIQRMALELRLSAGIDDQAFNELLNKTPSLLPQASANSLVMLSKESKESQGRRDQFIKTAENLLRSNDQIKAVEMSKRVQYFDADKAEIERLSKSTCQLAPQNKKAAQYHLSIAGEAVGANLNFSCP